LTVGRHDVLRCIIRVKPPSDRSTRFGHAAKQTSTETTFAECRTFVIAVAIPYRHLEPPTLPFQGEAVSYWLINETGQIWRADSEQLRLQTGCEIGSIRERAEFLETNLGFASLQQTKRGLFLRWRPTFVRGPTFAALVQLLRDQPEGRVVISTLKQSWSDKLLGSIELAVAELAQEFSTATCEVGGYFRASHRVKGSLPSSSPIHKMLSCAQDCGFRFQADALWAALYGISSGGYLLLEPVAETQKLRIAFHGQGYRTLSKEWQDRASGRFFEEQPDAHYARMSSRSFWRAVEQDIPIIEDVDASIWAPARGRTGLKYTRLLLPLTIGSKRHLLSMSHLISPTRHHLIEKH
jgi:hypothetical protein